MRAAEADPANKHREPLWGAPRIHGEPLKLGFYNAIVARLICINGVSCGRSGFFLRLGVKYQP